MPSPDVLLHLTTLPAWFGALRAGRLETPSLATHGFVHLSPPDAVAVPANALYRDEADVWLLVIDPAALRAPVRWEPAEPPTGEPARFPHLYGPLNLDAVVAVVPYARGADGSFPPPSALPRRADTVPRALSMEWYLARARAARVSEVPGGVSVRHPDYSVSYEHNRLVLHTPLDRAEAEALCARELAGLAHWQVCVDGPVGATTVRGFTSAGWSHVEDLLMVATPPLTPRGDDVAVERVPGEELLAPRAAMWRREIPGVGDETVRQLLQREQLNEEVTDLHHLVVRAEGAIAAQADLYVLGATAQIDWVETEPEHRGRGYGGAIVRAAARRAHEAGCDLVFLRADAADWPWRFYERLGFERVGSAHVFDRDVPEAPDPGPPGRHL